MSKQRIVKLAKFTAGVAILLCLAYPLRAAASTISTFNTDTEGWSAVGDVAGPVTWLPSGGNPAGHIELTDEVIGGVTYFVAPAKFHSNYSSAYGTGLTFDLRQSYTGSPNQFDDSDVILVGGGLTLVFDTPMNPSNNGWTSYNIALTDLSGWHVSTLLGPLATQAQILSTLANLTDLEIRAEYQTGPDTDSLDNVFSFFEAIIGSRRCSNGFDVRSGSFGTRTAATEACHKIIATKRFPSSRCASAIQIVRPLESIAETQPKLRFSFLRL